MTSATSRRTDPTQTGVIRRGYARELGRRLTALAREVRHLLMVEQALGPPRSGRLQLNQRWAFDSDPQKIDQFNRWVRARLRKELVELDDPNAEHWAQKFIRHSYEKGLTRAYTDVQKIAKRRGTTLLDQTQSNFLRRLYGDRKTFDALQVLFSRNLSLLEGVSDDMAHKLTQILAEGLLNRRSTATIARAITKQFKSLSAGRAQTLVNTEITHAHATAQLAAFERLGVKRLGVMAEWVTAQDEKVCPQCRPLQGIVVSLSQARGMIPRHPNCRCAWVPAELGQDRPQQKTGRQEIRAAIGKSLRAETKQRSTRAARRKTRWAGADNV